MLAHVVHCLIFKTEISWSEKVPSAAAGMELMSFGTVILRLGGKYWRSSAEIFFFSSKPTGGGNTPSLGLQGELLSYDSLLQ